MNTCTEIKVPHYMVAIDLFGLFARRKFQFTVQSDGEQSPYRFFLPSLPVLVVRNVIAEEAKHIPLCDLKFFITTALEITVLDAPGQGGACHEYEIDQVGGAPDSGGGKTLIKFQNGPIGEFGVNGVSGEALLAIQIDRLRSFQAGPFACRENALALTALEESLMWLQKRTRDRLARGVEGTNVK